MSQTQVKIKPCQTMGIFDTLPEAENVAQDITPGDMLREHLQDAGISSYMLAKRTGLSQTRISEIINKGRAITVETALKLGKFFGTSARYWMNIQASYDLRVARVKYKDELETIECGSTRFLDHKDLKNIELCVSCKKLRAKK